MTNTQVKSNSHFIHGTHKLVEAIRWLDGEGYAVLSIRHNEACPAKPTLVIQPERRLKRLVLSGKAAYFGAGCQPLLGRFREGQFHTPNGLRVVWIEQEAA